MADKKGIEIKIPGFWDGNNRIKAVFSDDTGTLSLEGELINGVRKRLRKLAEMVHIYVVTSCSVTFAGTVVAIFSSTARRSDATIAHSSMPTGCPMKRPGGPCVRRWSALRAN
jgi:hypothetical protein